MGVSTDTATVTSEGSLLLFDFTKLVQQISPEPTFKNDTETRRLISALKKPGELENFLVTVTRQSVSSFVADRDKGKKSIELECEISSELTATTDKSYVQKIVYIPGLIGKPSWYNSMHRYGPFKIVTSDDKDIAFCKTDEDDHPVQQCIEEKKKDTTSGDGPAENLIKCLWEYAGVDRS